MSSPLPLSPFRTDCLQGKIALVTGGGSGIGYEIVQQLILHGCQGVVICGRRRSFLDHAVQRLRATAAAAAAVAAAYTTVDSARPVPWIEAFVCDVRHADQCQAAVQFVQQQQQQQQPGSGQLHILVNAAAGNFLAQAKDLSPNGFATVMAIDAIGTFNMSRAAFGLLKQSAAEPSSSQLSSMMTSSSSLIINISATVHYGATYWQVHASAAKAAIDSLTRSLALEWGTHNIRVVGIAPGPIADTPGTTKLAPSIIKNTKTSTAVHDSATNQSATDDLAQRLAQQAIPLGRMGKAYEIGYAVIYLCTASYVTGDTLVVDGGHWLYRPPLVPAEQVANLSRQMEGKSRAQAPPLTPAVSSRL